MEKKRILVITGSPRKNGNSDLLAEAFIEGALQAGHTVERFDSGRKKVRGCIACDKCFTRGTACAVKDDFDEVAPLIAQADTLVFSSPLYYFSFPAQIKGVIDRLYSFNSSPEPLKIKETVLLACGETSDLTDFEGMAKTYEKIASYLTWKDRGQLLVPGVYDKGDINTKGQDYLKSAKELGFTL
ncbi:multimeric flavodoxin WrbA [Parabacteroides sp. PF5-5]|uniref:flavodoxin family protein n=1 Tax=unclassified Parabacteroides TaxID=2649774 RepID=UPI002476B8D0|nr:MULTISPECIES: flavodoxin family protein [unclassified Parabacteroides]MDH6305488.1 multimeric flavodoxin WrbA [Parabacteroides sp. PH5-39]MDH6316238.1 multimeric flavodoxin WrbA [Parabacteroides sp. PF5-13]MDH6320348.1 multimeric flavodoxin WrbA [Parabacteroides sp. PH5-13]MDH6324078.1 multimeric flavodoxin WrbA [Parabacteroides sp. PH5-8]MDH6329070.1 multimeric flavodoxin WrbA [Parabacteroides sp. PH5-41]